MSTYIWYFTKYSRETTPIFLRPPTVPPLFLFFLSFLSSFRMSVSGLTLFSPGRRKKKKRKKFRGSNNPLRKPLPTPSWSFFFLFLFFSLRPHYMYIYFHGVEKQIPVSSFPPTPPVLSFFLPSLMCYLIFFGGKTSETKTLWRRAPTPQPPKPSWQFLAFFILFFLLRLHYICIIPTLKKKKLTPIPSHPPPFFFCLQFTIEP